MKLDAWGALFLINQFLRLAARRRRQRGRGYSDRSNGRGDHRFTGRGGSHTGPGCQHIVLHGHLYLAWEFLPNAILLLSFMFSTSGHGPRLRSSDKHCLTVQRHSAFRTDRSSHFRTEHRNSLTWQCHEYCIPHTLYSNICIVYRRHPCTTSTRTLQVPNPHFRAGTGLGLQLKSGRLLTPGWSDTSPWPGHVAAAMYRVPALSTATTMESQCPPVCA